MTNRRKEEGIVIYEKPQNRTNNNRKPQNRKLQAKSEKTCTRLRSLRRKFSEEKLKKTKQHRIANLKA